MPFVVDVSVAAAWAFPDEQGPYPNGVLARLRQDRAIVPPIWPWELANVLLIGERRGRISPADTATFLVEVGSLPITVDDELSLHAVTFALGFARTLGVTTYDASYLELAVRLGLPLATQDKKLTAAAAVIGVPIFDPDPDGASSNGQDTT
jgi:predicted nucleic acid-binding protein